MIRTFWVIYLAVIALFLVVMVTRCANAHDGMHDQWFRSLHVGDNPNGMLCCNKNDCRPVVAHIRPDGHYEAFIDKATFPDNPMNAFEGNAPDTWVEVPDAAILHGHDNPTGEPIACWWSGQILCFVEGVGT